MVDNKLNWKLQIKSICSKLSSVCGVISKVRHYLDRKALMLIYNSLFDSRLRYAILGWGTASNQEISKIRVLQNRVVRFINFSPFRTSMAPLYSNLKILPFDQILFLQKSVFMHNLHYKNLPFALSTYCNQPTHRYSTRYASSGNYVLPCAKTNRGQRSIKYTGPKTWAEVPKTIKEIAFRKPFSKNLKQHLLSISYVEMPAEPTSNSESVNENVGLEGLQLLFLTNENRDISPGLEASSSFSEVEAIFHAESSDEEFLGF